PHIAAKKLFPNWEREMTELGFKESDYELYNKNLMSLKGNRFLDEFNRYGGADLIVIDEAHEGIRNYRNRIHQICLQIRESDRASERQRHFLLLTATPWNNRREDIYNILSPFLSRPEGFKDLDFPPEVAFWFERRDAGVENFTDNTNLFRRTYRELFLQRTRQMLREATPDLNLYAKRVAQWLPVEFEPDTEQALDQIFTQFETNLYIPSADPIRYLKGSSEQRS
ncbi:MAG: helicase-related protein, partial [Microcystaceae cyanobacterium]